MTNDTTTNGGDFTYEEARAAVWYGPREARIEIAGEPYRGAHTRRAVRTAMTRAGVTECTINGCAGWNKAGLAYRFELT
jgi:hypothetical protein